MTISTLKILMVGRISFSFSFHHTYESLVQRNVMLEILIPMNYLPLMVNINLRMPVTMPIFQITMIMES